MLALPVRLGGPIGSLDCSTGDAAGLSAEDSAALRRFADVPPRPDRVGAGGSPSRPARSSRRRVAELVAEVLAGQEI